MRILFVPKVLSAVFRLREFRYFDLKKIDSAFQYYLFLGKSGRNFLTEQGFETEKNVFRSRLFASLNTLRNLRQIAQNPDFRNTTAFRFYFASVVWDKFW